ncbi:hypothetical protein BDV93DRAFT_609740 [Ceratobasidium sp. AG-I]|nr:hypothetical protein BDV93DRAFT_609740 [Ceratobasidium sp. AG-I]
MSLIREKAASRPRDVVPSLTKSYILIAFAILTLGIAMYPRYSAPGHWRFRHGFTRHGYHKYEHRYEPNRPVVGIDLGHAYSRAAIMRNRTIEMITTAQGSPEIPSWESTWSFDRQLNRSDYYFNLTSRGNGRPIHAKSGWQKVLQQAAFDQNVILKEQWNLILSGISKASHQTKSENPYCMRYLLSARTRPTQTVKRSNTRLH